MVDREKPESKFAGASITWLGEDDLHTDGNGPRFTTAWGGQRFELGKAVELDDMPLNEVEKEHMLKTACAPYWEVSGYEHDDDHKA